MQEEPKDRLKRARQNARMSVDMLAKLCGRSVSTVHAHENGQNGIRKAAAESYAVFLDVSPDWILFGTGAGPRTAEELEKRGRQIPIVAEIRRGHYVHSSWNPSEFVYVDPADYMHISALEGYRLMDSTLVHDPGTILFVAAFNEIPVINFDTVVLRRHVSGLTEVVLAYVDQANDDELDLHLHSTNAFPKEVVRVRLNELNATDWPSEQRGPAYDICGPVVGSMWWMPPRLGIPIKIPNG